MIKVEYSVYRHGLKRKQKPKYGVYISKPGSIDILKWFSSTTQAEIYIKVRHFFDLFKR